MKEFKLKTREKEVLYTCTSFCLLVRPLRVSMPAIGSWWTGLILHHHMFAKQCLGSWQETAQSLVGHVDQHHSFQGTTLSCSTHEEPSDGSQDGVSGLVKRKAKNATADGGHGDGCHLHLLCFLQCHLYSPCKQLLLFFKNNEKIKNEENMPLFQVFKILFK